MRGYCFGNVSGYVPAQSASRVGVVVNGLQTTIKGMHMESFDEW